MLAKQKWQADTIKVLEEIFEERIRQVEKYGHNEDLEGGNGPESRWLIPLTFASAAEAEAEFRREYEDFEEEIGKPTWVHLIREEVAEAFREDDPKRLQEELVQVAALCVSWVEKIRSKS